MYGTTLGVFDFNSPPNYGYSFSTSESDTPANTNGVTLHTVVLTGLVPGTTYYYRTISHASPDTISYERSFTTSGKAFPQSNAAAAVSGSEEVLGASLAMSGAESGDITPVTSAEFGSENTPEGEPQDHAENIADAERKSKDDSSTSIKKAAAVVSGATTGNWIMILIGGLLLLGIFYGGYRFLSRRRF